MSSGLEEFCGQHGTALPPHVQGRVVGLMDELYLLQLLLEYAADERPP